MEKKPRVSPRTLIGSGLALVASGALFWISRGYPSAYDLWAVGVGTVLFLAGAIIAAVRG